MPMQANSQTESVRDIAIRDCPDGFDSIKAVTAGTECYMLYSNANYHTYPMFLVYFKWKSNKL